ncbi:MAG: polysaccharide pyruvyl transferase family protein [Myxococcales bacterium]|jgi:polysaccharide pyruvyl transferase CsaB
MAKIFHVGISGSYGGSNLGDEAILAGIIGELRRTIPVEITVFSRNPEDTLRRHQVERAVPVRHALREEMVEHLRSLDLFVLGGGGILFNGEARLYLRELNLAHELGVPTMVYAVGVGPLLDPEARAEVCTSLEAADVVTVRDRIAKRLLEQCNVRREVAVTADPALLVTPEPVSEQVLAHEGMLGRRVVGMSVRERGPAAPELNERGYHELLANVADYVVDRLDADVVFVPMERRHTDMQHSYAVLARIRSVQRASVLRGEYTSGQLLSIIGRFEFCVGMRLHFLIFSAMQQVPFVALPYAPKVAGFVEELGLAVPPIERLNPGKLIAHLDRSWDQRDQLRDHLKHEMGRLKQRARQNNEILVDLLTRERRLPLVRGAASEELEPEL